MLAPSVCHLDFPFDVMLSAAKNLVLGGRFFAALSMAYKAEADIGHPREVVTDLRVRPHIYTVTGHVCRSIVPDRSPPFGCARTRSWRKMEVETGYAP